MYSGVGMGVAYLLVVVQIDLVCTRYMESAAGTESHSVSNGHRVVHFHGCLPGDLGSGGSSSDFCCILIHGQVTIIFVVSVCLFLCVEFFSAVFDPISVKLGHMLYV